MCQIMKNFNWMKKFYIWSWPATVCGMYARTSKQLSYAKIVEIPNRWPAS